MATTQYAPRRGMRGPERADAREHRRALIAASPRRYEVDAEGRTWLVVTLPDPGELWVARVSQEAVAEELDGPPPDYNPLDDGIEVPSEAAPSEAA